MAPKTFVVCFESFVKVVKQMGKFKTLKLLFNDVLILNKISSFVTPNFPMKYILFLCHE